jgi:chemotaxis protein MotB
MARRYKKVDGGHGHHGGAWKVAYADFVTAMMALFMVLWLLASTDQQSRKEISNYFRTGLMPQVDLATRGSPQTTSVFMGAAVTPPPPPVQLASASANKPGAEGSGGADERIATANDLVKRLQRFAAVDGELKQVMRNVRVQVTDDGILIEAVDEGKGLLFDSSSSRLNEPLARFLRTLGPALATLGKPIEINGHTDARPFAQGARVSNWDLSYQRASAALEILEASGVADSQVTGVFARGASQLYLPNEPMAPQNRRLSVLIKIAKNGDTKLASAERGATK